MELRLNNHVYAYMHVDCVCVCVCVCVWGGSMHVLPRGSKYSAIMALGPKSLPYIVSYLASFWEGGVVPEGVL